MATTAPQLAQPTNFFPSSLQPQPHPPHKSADDQTKLTEEQIAAVDKIQAAIQYAIAVGAIPQSKAQIALNVIPMLIFSPTSVGAPAPYVPPFPAASTAAPQPSLLRTVSTAPPSFGPPSFGLSSGPLPRFPQRSSYSPLGSAATAATAAAAVAPAPVPTLAASPFAVAPSALTAPSLMAASLPSLGRPVPAAASLGAVAVAGSLASLPMPSPPSLPGVPSTFASPGSSSSSPMAPLAGLPPTMLRDPLPPALQAVYEQESQGDAADPTLLTMKGVRETGDKWFNPLDVAPSIDEVVAAAVPVLATTIDDVCSVCLEGFSEGRPALRLHRCHPGHYYHDACIKMSLSANMKCPNCSTLYGMPCGGQPAGRMAITLQPFQLPGEPDSFGTYMIAYQFPSGLQGPRHPSPGTPYAGTSRRAFIPGTPRGRQVLRKFLRAWDARLLFTVGTSVTTGKPNCVIWNGIHHKTNVSGGPCQFGFPDATYLDSVEAELAGVGIA